MHSIHTHTDTRVPYAGYQIPHAARARYHVRHYASAYTDAYLEPAASIISYNDI